MYQIRNNVFETNSSSTHSICISKTPTAPKDKISFYLGKFGWEEGCVNAADYLYTAIMCIEEYNPDEGYLDKLKNILDDNGIEYKFEEPNYNKWGGYDFYIDHTEDLPEFIDMVLNDEDMLMRLLFNSDSCVYTGNDNSNDNMDMCYSAFPTAYYYEDGDWRRGREIPNPNHDPERYDYFFKGN